jgi:ribonuclease HI
MEQKGSSYVKEYSEGFRKTTNNRMELLAVIEALKKLKKDNLSVVVFTDSKYVVDSVEKKWIFTWEKNSFKKKKNIDLWIEFLKIFRKHTVRFKWIKGHNNHPQNERCDHLALEASKKETLLIDRTYENQDNQNLL